MFFFKYRTYFILWHKQFAVYKHFKDKSLSLLSEKLYLHLFGSILDSFFRLFKYDICGIILCIILKLAIKEHGNLIASLISLDKIMMSLKTSANLLPWELIFYCLLISDWRNNTHEFNIFEKLTFQILQQYTKYLVGTHCFNFAQSVEAENQRFAKILRGSSNWGVFITKVKYNAMQNIRNIPISTAFFPYIFINFDYKKTIWTLSIRFLKPTK